MDKDFCKKKRRIVTDELLHESETGSSCEGWQNRKTEPKFVYLELFIRF